MVGTWNTVVKERMMVQKHLIPEVTSGSPTHSQRLEIMNKLDATWYRHMPHAVIPWALYSCCLSPDMLLPAISA